jgi:hypothetical protein
VSCCIIVELACLRGFNTDKVCKHQIQTDVETQYMNSLAQHQSAYNDNDNDTVDTQATAALQ